MFYWKKFFFFCLFMFAGTQITLAQVTGSFQVKGDLDKYYPVTFADGGWNNNAAVELELGRSSVHIDGEWRGSIIAKFRFHVTAWGNGSAFINVDMMQFVPTTVRFVAGWTDVSRNGIGGSILIWLRGNTTYNYKCNYAFTPVIYDNVQQPLPYQEPGGPAHTFKTAVDSTVNSYGITYGNAMYLTANTNHYIAGNVGIGTLTPGSCKLAVEGTIGARKVKVTQGTWADFVFQPDYTLPPLSDVEAFIKENKHLPDIPTKKEVEKEGLDLGEMNKKLLQKIEELTLYLIDLKKENTRQWQEIEQLKKNK
ncbi:hypothetical protein FHW36_104187 [Chitinophaga polysaccharea]|uniref:Uncharacterized protein n=1 Tax=Chitinophaga polysaccharea TaxID=1293035 RepID=A0A561PQW9_9BACT|nr:hypothetical protein [Chitinophaga polysaccharea]TWF40505.1 hypothetical protein FHW36_104187 [Chitinophaga polysaccharea]